MPPLPDSEPTDRELDALKVLWEAIDTGSDGETVRQVVDRLNDGGAGLAYTTVLSLLQVMEEKGLVDHVRQGKAYVYRPLVQRKKTLGRLAGGFLEKVFDGAVHEYLVHALQGRKLTSAEMDELEAMLANARARQSKQRKRPKQGDA